MHRLLRTHWQEARLPENFQILDADDQQRLVKRILHDLDLDEKRWPRAKWPGSSMGRRMRASGTACRTGRYFTETLLKVYEAYETLSFKGDWWILPAPLA